MTQPASAPPPFRPPPPEGAASTPNQMASTGPGSAAYAEWERQHEEALSEQRRHAAESAARAAQLHSDYLKVVWPLWEARLAYLEKRAPRSIERAPMFCMQICAAGGAVTAFLLAHDKPMPEFLLKVAVGTVLGGAAGLAVGSVTKEVLPRRRVPVPPVMPPDIETKIYDRWRDWPTWRWEAARETWRALSEQHNADNKLTWTPVLEMASAIGAMQRRGR